ncbi:hypothetical protein QYM36_005621 [Artemia franciscana]|uniref:Conserved oligomeric Golgi complex subunit 6 n=1 Tax=Artemia franciscana TaxID=6661 RepID=A0AA88HYP1_ARTSF|nr:hypothetical protein QYM36_005621 [Artemia franciscana]
MKYLHQDLLEALEEVSNLFNENTINERRHLRGKLEKASLDVQKQLLESLENVIDAVDDVYIDVKTLHDSCVSLKEQLYSVKASSKPFFIQAQKLKVERTRIHENELELANLLNKYQLDEKESNILLSKDYPFNQSLTLDFFRALDKLMSIQKSCEMLAAEGYEKLSRETYDSMETLKEQALDRIFKWCQLQVRVADVNNIHPLLRRSLKYLEVRPTYIEHLFEEYSSARQSVVLRQFQEALAKAEDLMEDPPRYLGDVLAWIHQASLSEVDALNIVLKLDGNSGLEKVKDKAIGRLTDGISVPFTTRSYNMALNKQLELETIAKATAVASFYLQTFYQILPKACSFLVAMDNFCSSCLLRIGEQLNLYGSQISSFLRVPPSDLSAPPEYMLFLSSFSSVLWSLSASEQVPDDELRKISYSAIEPILSIVSEPFEALSRMDDAIYSINLLEPLLKKTVLYGSLEEKTRSLEAQITRHIATVSAVYTTELLQVFGLAGFLPALSSPDSNEKRFDKSSLTQLSERLVDASIFSGSPEITNLKLLPPSKKEVIKTSVNAVSSIYLQLYEAVKSSETLKITPEKFSELLLSVIP